MTQEQQVRQIVLDAYSLLRSMEFSSQDEHTAFTPEVLQDWRRRFDNADRIMPQVLDELEGLGLDPDQVKQNLGL
jgi:hypothetical protein